MRSVFSKVGLAALTAFSLLLLLAQPASAAAISVYSDYPTLYEQSVVSYGSASEYGKTLDVYVDIQRQDHHFYGNTTTVVGSCHVTARDFAHCRPTGDAWRVLGHYVRTKTHGTNYGNPTDNITRYSSWVYFPCPRSGC